MRVFRFASGRFWHYHFFGRYTIIDTYGTSFRALSYLEAMKSACQFQWEFQDPKMEVLYHIRPYFLGIFSYIGRLKLI